MHTKNTYFSKKFDETFLESKYLFVLAKKVVKTQMMCCALCGFWAWASYKYISCDLNLQHFRSTQDANILVSGCLQVEFPLIGKSGIGWEFPSVKHQSGELSVFTNCNGQNSFVAFVTAAWHLLLSGLVVITHCSWPKLPINPVFSLTCFCQR